MAQRSLQWPKLIGSFVGLEALGIFMCQARLLFWSSENSGWPDAWMTWFWLILATALSVLAYCLYRAHNWARVAVIIMGISLCAFFVWTIIGGELSWAEMVRREKTGREFWLYMAMSAVDTVGVQLGTLLAPLGFIIGILCHRDVAAAFRTSAKRSNHAMERTAGSLGS
jgi:cell division protein FtsW (lipid II flippase)